MSTTRCFASLKPPAQLLNVLLAAALVAPAAAFGGDCGNNEPAFPVPECRDESDGTEVSCSASNAVRIWPDGFQPGLPGQQLPLDRDSTQWRSLTIPSFQFGHELFQYLDIVGDHLYVAYNAGLQVWNIAGNNDDNPNRVDLADGYAGGFLEYPGPGEDDFFVFDIAAINPAGGNQDVLIALAGKFTVGPTIWEHTIASGDLVQKYQDLGTDSKAMRVAEVDGTAYAFAGATSGVIVYDMDRAQTLVNPCLDNEGSVCPGVYKGPVGNIGFVAYLDIIERAGKLYVAVTKGGGLPMEIWEVSDPSSPGSAVQRFDGPGAEGVALFQKGNDYYMAIVQRISPPANFEIRIYNVNSCLDTNGCGSLGAPEWAFPLSQPAQERFLTFSTSNGTPFLYFGLQANNLEGRKAEGLFDLTTLGTTNQITEVTDGGGTYTDECSGNTVDYWGDYYPSNGNGLRNVTPRIGKFKDEFFYRAAFGILDVHQFGSSGGNPRITVAANSSPPFYMDDAIAFSATAEDCDVVPNGWDWTHNDPLTSQPPDSDDMASILFELCATPDCPSRNIQVSATNTGCPEAQVIPVNVTVQEPRPYIRDIEVCPTSDPGCAQVPEPTFPVCTMLRFTADVDGQPTLLHTWQVRDAAGGVLDPPGPVNSTIFTWDTSDVMLGPPPPEIFADGFESGDVCVWSSSVPPEDCGLPRAATPVSSSGPAIFEQLAKGGDSAIFDIELALNNSSGTDMDSLQVTLTAIGTLGFDSPAIDATDQGSGEYAFQANSQNATAWRWEFEDPENGTAAGCEFYASCQIYDYGVDDDQTTFQWTSPNEDGNYGVTVSIDNCQEEPQSASITVNVTGIVDPEPPVITSFSVDLGDPSCTCSIPLGSCTCQLGDSISFDVVSTGDPDTYEFDWDGDGIFNEPGEPPVPVGNPVAHSYGQAGTYTPAVRAVKGPQTSAPYTCEQTILIE